jgi:hypothetical protein
VIDLSELTLHPRILVWVIVLAIGGVFQDIAVIGQVSPGSSANMRSTETAKGKRTHAAAAEPRPPACPAAALPTLLPSPLLTGQHKATLTWNASAPSVNSENNAVGYCLYRSRTQNAAKQYVVKQISKCSDCEQVNSIALAGTGCVDDLVQDGATYYYVVIAVNAKGEPSSPSNETPAQIPPNKQSVSSPSVGSYPFCRATTGSK